MHVNKINDKKYIGQTCQEPEKRWASGYGYTECPKFWNAIKKYGWNGFEHIIVHGNLTLNEANLLEEELIRKYKTTSDMYGYNLQSGGQNKLHSDETKKKIKDSYKYRITEDSKKKMSNARKGMYNGKNNPKAHPIVQLTKDNVFVKHWDYIKEAADCFNVNEASIRACCVGKQKSSCGYKWMYIEEYEKMNKKKQRFLVMSDVHGFYDEMIKALNEANFNPETDFLISLGDTTDRGPDPLKVIRYLESLPNKVIIRGNHEGLVLECCERGYWCSHDMSNGTFDTICELGGAGGGRSFDECCIIAESIVKPFFNSMVNYFETKNYVFVHGFIPVECNKSLPRNYKPHLKYSKKEDWRYAHQSEWDDAMWLNGMEMAMDGFSIEKTIVCGHFHTSWGHAIQDKTFNEFGEGADFSPFYYEDKLIAIDACTAHTGKVNVLVLEDEFM